MPYKRDKSKRKARYLDRYKYKNIPEGYERHHVTYVPSFVMFLPIGEHKFIHKLNRDYKRIYHKEIYQNDKAIL